MTQAQQEIVVFDALCVLCSANARFVLARDADRRFLLAAMQGEAGRRIYEEAGIELANPETLVVKTADGLLLRDSNAVLHLWRHLGWRRLAAICGAVPRLIRDPLYRLVARNRYRLFGRRAECWLPDPADRQRLL